MAGIFDGIATIHRGIFGDTVTIHPTDGEPRDIPSIFREVPTDLNSEIPADVTEIRDLVPVLRASKLDVVDLKPGDRVDFNGKSYKCLPRQIETNPADDANVAIPLELIGV